VSMWGVDGCYESDKLNKVWKLAVTTAGMSWKDADRACRGSGLEMCRYQDLCPCKMKNKARIGTLAGDKWTPISGDGTNQWVQLGNRPWPQCVLHDELQGGKYGRPAWGEARNRHAAHGPLYCCGKEELKTAPADIVRIGAAYDFSWDDARNTCENNGMKMCNYASLCPEGPGGSTSITVLSNSAKDNWVPFAGEADGSWVQMGSGHWPTCQRHSEINGGKYGIVPGWGRTRHRGSWKRNIFCCGKPLVRTLRVKVAEKMSGLTWNNGARICKGNGLEMCNFYSLCPNGKGQTPYNGRTSGDNWSPIGGEGSNQWIQLGDRWPQCFRHTEIPGGLRYGPWGRPGWGNSHSRAPYKGNLWCCGSREQTKVKRFSPVEGPSTRGKSWDDARAYCASKSQQLCRFVDLCPKGPHTTPSTGEKTNKDVWIPLGGEGQNRWLQIGSRPWPACLRHNEIANGKYGAAPGWGKDRSSHHWKGPVYCCAMS